MISLLIMSSLAGLMIPLGGWLGAQENIQRDWLREEFRHSVIAFGGGALLSAIMLVLIPEGQKHQGGSAVILLILTGAVLMALLDAILQRAGSNRAQQIAMLADFAPEALALGAVFAADRNAAILLALMMGLQNLPEGFNAFREQLDIGGKRRAILLNFLGLAAIGPAAALIGFFWLAYTPSITAAIMLLAAGAILYLIFQDIAPQIRLKNHFGPPLGAVAGFLLGLTGDMMIG